ncbi:MAG TPA: serine/threonine-protein kinase [Candidatus Paceibacterota bacterium]|nr:serine/threonine-protein kinase [Candidatus Paceibacterota bacterium]
MGRSEKALFAAARELTDAAQRRAFLDAACAGDPQMRQRVEELLAAQGEADHFFMEGAAALEPDAATVLLPVTEKPGDRIGRYKLLQQIGEGGCGIVYVAEQEEPVRRRVALKVIKLGMDTKQVIARFEAERQALALMDHPNIAKVFDAGSTERPLVPRPSPLAPLSVGRPYFVMELVRGIKITDYCDQNNLSMPDRLQLFIQVCHAIQHAHQKGIIHRDIKPSNILVTVNDGVPVPKVIDFGIAKATNQQRLTDKTIYTAFEQFIGTPAYMSPEQAQMTSLDIDTRSDIYALGVLLYELLTGKTPFDAKTLVAAGLDEMRRIIREEQPVRPSTRITRERLAASAIPPAKSAIPSAKSAIHNPQSAIDQDLDWIVMKCLEKDRTRRYETANGLAMDIERHLSHQPVAARPPSAAYRIQKFVRRNKLMVGAAATVVAALVLGIVGSAWQAVIARRAQHDAEQARAGEQRQLRQTEAALKQAEAARQQAEAHELEARRQTYAADMNNAQQALAINDLGRVRQLLDAYRPRPGGPDPRGWEWRYLWQECRSDALYEFCRYSNTTHAVAFSIEGSLLAVAGLHPEYVDLWELRTRRKVATLQAQAGHLVSFSPRGDLLATDGPGGEIRLYQAGSTNLVCQYQIPHADKRIVALKFSPDGTLLASLGQSWNDSLPAGVMVWEVDQRTNLWQSPATSLGFLGSLDFSPDSQALAIGDADGQLRVAEARTGAKRFQFAAHSEGISSVAWSPTARVIATGSGYVGGPIRLWDANTGKSMGSLEGHTSWICELIFSADGQRLYSAGADQTIRIWDVEEQRGLAVLRGNTDEVYGLALSPDGKTLASAGKDGIIAIWSTEPRLEEEQPRILAQGKSAGYVFSPDNRVLAATCGGIVTLFELPSLRFVHPIPALGTNVTAVAYSSDGNRLAGGCADGTVRVWSCVEQRLVHSLSAHDAPIHMIRFVGDNNRLFSVDMFPKVIEWGADERPRARCEFPEANAIDLSPNGRLLVWGDRLGSIHWWDLDAGESLGSQFAHRDVVIGVAFSRDSSRVGTVGNDASVAVWDASSRALLRPVFKGHMHGAHSVAFSPHGRRLVTTGGAPSEAIRLWDPFTSRELATLAGKGQIINRGVSFSSDGNWLAACSLAGQLNLWHAPSWEEIAAAEAKDNVEARQP